ncbi:hypothetical protein B0H65DRAFT_465072 [Neurospora tetraspora]|uniref:Uncharacterized protein n=1 Tax=Neurospora tetraspora TaxID=94610 RepID=A0AAE0JES9_9PEZI|nr:hypothetical protein B0H65DRAFT_465072 [Neurospora tetraspora]
MPWVDVAEHNPWLSSEDEGASTYTAPTIKEEPRGVVVLEIPSSSPSPIPKGQDVQVVPELPGTHLPAPIAAPNDRAASSHSSPSNSHTNTPRPTTPAGPSVVNGGEGPYNEKGRYGTPSHAHTSQSFAVRNSSSPVAAVSELKRHSSSESLSPAPTEDGGIDDDDDDDDDDDKDGTELKSHVRDPPCFLCVVKTMRGKDSVCYGPAIINHERRTCVNCKKCRRRCDPSPELVLQSFQAWKAERSGTVASERAMKTLKATCAAYRNLQQLVKVGMVPNSTVETLLSGGDPFLPEVPSRAEFTALMRRVKSLEASLQRQNVLRGHSGARTKKAGRRKPDEVKKDEKDPELPDHEDEESYDEETEDEWLP